MFMSLKWFKFVISKKLDLLCLLEIKVLTLLSKFLLRQHCSNLLSSKEKQIAGHCFFLSYSVRHCQISVSSSHCSKSSMFLKLGDTNFMSLILCLRNNLISYLAVVCSFSSVADLEQFDSTNREQFDSSFSRKILLSVLFLWK